MPGQCLTAVPVLASHDFDRTIEFYGLFGYHLCARYPGRYLILRRDGAELHFNLNTSIDPETNFRMCYVRILNAKALNAEWSALNLPEEGAPRYVPAELKDWGMIEAHSVDPDGNLVIYGVADEGFAR